MDLRPHIYSNGPNFGPNSMDFLACDYCSKMMIFILPTGKSWIFAVLWDQVALHKGSWLVKPHS